MSGCGSRPKKQDPKVEATVTKSQEVGKGKARELVTATQGTEDLRSVIVFVCSQRL